MTTTSTMSTTTFDRALARRQLWSDDDRSQEIRDKATATNDSIGLAASIFINSNKVGKKKTEKKLFKDASKNLASNFFFSTSSLIKNKEVKKAI